MIIVLRAVGAAAVLIGLAAVGYGIPIRDFGFGNLLIMTGTVGLCTGLLLLGLSVVASELRLVARRLAAPRPAADPRARAALPPFPAGVQAPVAAAEGGPLFTRDQPSPPPPPLDPTAAPPMAPPWHDDGPRARPDAPPELDPAQAAAPPPKQRRNLMFSSSMRRDRERAGAPEEPSAPATPPPPLPAASEASEAPPASFEDAWPKSGRARSSEVPPQRRSSRLAPAPAPTESNAGAAPERPASPPVPAEQAPAVTVLKSGVVDGMAYSLYSDGSIEAQMPEGMMRFASIDELRAHLEQRQ